MRYFFVYNTLIHNEGFFMPLIQGNSKDVIHRNIKELIDSGKPKDQAVAIAYKEAGMAKDVDFDELGRLFDQWLKEESKEKEHAMDSARHIDDNGHLIVDRTVITKAAVNPYLGREIPNHQGLGLQPDKIYNLLRDPEELRKGMNTFAAIQLLLQHIPVDAMEPQKELTVGAIGSEFEMDDEGRVWAMLRVHDQEGIDYIQSGKMQELSAGYAYTPDMTAGEWNGIPYDGVMRDIRGNHVAIVERGRIGRDAIVADEMPNDIEDFLMKKVALKKGALAELKTQLGMDSDEAVKKVILAVHGSLALDSYDKKAEDEDDEDKKAEDEIEIIEKEDVAEDEDKQTQADRDNESEAMRLKEREKREEKDRNRDKREAAMDADTVRTQIMGLFSAARKVEPLVGELALDGFSSAADVYAYALSKKGVQTKGINEAGLAALVDVHLSTPKAPVIAQDAAYAEPSVGLASLTKHIRKGV